MVEAARRLPWHVEIVTLGTGLGHALNLLLEHCRRTCEPDAWQLPAAALGKAGDLLPAP
jgi:hypothetical protein